ncbi:MAG TPA: hypothetical protein VFW40_08650 [Capsulimonadaceae bacterium]|nr:hypothetical protein [Capsulimonadaceae bacterium]
MATATDPQVQNFCNEVLRPLCEATRDLQNRYAAALASIGDVYANVTQQSPTWTDNRTDGPPHLMTPGDVINLNGFFTRVIAAMTGDGQWPVVLDCCVQPES